MVVDGSGEPVAQERTRYLAGAGLHASQDVEQLGDPVTYFYADLLDSTMLATDEAGLVTGQVTYTAFGEVVVPDGQGGWTVGGELPAGLPRYGYAGGHGYESGLITLSGAPGSGLAPITLQHVGERWYQPNLGRFVQRDPIGIAGGLNVYQYCHANPLVAVDPSGLRMATSGPWWARWILNATGGEQHIPVIDYGTAHTVVVVTAEVVSVLAPAASCVRVVTLGKKGLKAAQGGGWITRKLLRLRRYIRYDRHDPHPLSPHPWDGDIIRWWVKRRGL